MIGSAILEGALRRDRIVVACGLLLVIALSWIYLLTGAGVMPEADGKLMAMDSVPWTPGHAAMMLLMWALMMAAMMLPSAAPMILLYTTIARARQAKGKQAVASGVFAFGYIAAWAVFSLVAVALQFSLDSAALLPPAMETTHKALAASILIAAGVYQWSPLKQACLRRCRSPLDFVLTHWREGRRGAIDMGFQHGAYCIGCCWMLMLLLFVGGIMNLAWIAGLSVFVLVEKLTPAGHWISRGTGIALIGWGIASLSVIG